MPDPAPADVARAADAVNQFANDVYQHFEAESGNIFLSPLSVATGLAMVLDQDTENFHRQRAGIKASMKAGQTLGNYQEVRIRRLHKPLDEYLEG